MLEGIGCTVHFVDAWFSHTLGGGIHCATNALYEPSSNLTAVHVAPIYASSNTIPKTRGSLLITLYRLATLTELG